MIKKKKQNRNELKTNGIVIRYEMKTWQNVNFCQVIAACEQANRAWSEKKGAVDPAFHKPALFTD